MTRLFLSSIAIFFAVFIALLSVSCTDNNAKNNPITIAISPWSGYSFALIAKELGYLNMEGEEQIKIIIYPSLSESRLAYINGNVDGLFSTMIEVIESAQQENKNPNIVLVTNISNGPDQILAKNTITEFARLKGKRIGVEQSSIGMYMLNRALEIHKFPFNEFSLVYMGAEHMAKALEDNLIDAAISYPPYTREIKKYAPNNLFNSSQIENEIIDLLAIENQIVNKHSEQVSLLIAAWIKAYEFYRSNPEKASQILKKYPEFSQIDLQNDLKEISLANYSNQADLFSSQGVLKKSLQNATRMMNKHNFISRNIDSDLIINKNILQLYPSAP